MIIQMLKLPHLLILITLKLGHASYFVKGKPNNKLKKKKKRLSIGSSTIANAINFTRGEGNSIKKMEMKKFITFQMLQNERMMIQGQL